MFCSLSGEADLLDSLNSTTSWSLTTWFVGGSCDSESSSLYDCGLRKIEGSRCPGNEVTVVRCSNGKWNALVRLTHFYCVSEVLL